jgi:hypothetical protein
MEKKKITEMEKEKITEMEEEMENNKNYIKQAKIILPYYKDKFSSDSNTLPQIKYLIYCKSIDVINTRKRKNSDYYITHSHSYSHSTKKRKTKKQKV